MTVTQGDWAATLRRLALPAEPEPWSLLDTGSTLGGEGTAEVLGFPVTADLDDSAWEDIERAATDRLADGGYVVLRRPGDGDRPWASGEVIAPWLGRFERLLRAGFTIHRGAAGCVSIRRARTGVLYLAPWLTFGGSDVGTIDWLRHLPSGEFRRYLHTTQPSENQLFAAAEALADEAWCLPDLMPGASMAQFVLGFIATRNVDVVHIMNSRLGFDLLPAMKSAFPHLRTVVQLHVEEEDRSGYCRYVTTRYGNLVDGFSLTSEDLRGKVRRYQMSPSKLHVIYTGLDPDRFDPGPSAGAHTRRATGSPGLDVLFPARLTAQKDPLLMVRVAASLRDAGSASVIHVVGDGELRGDVESAIAAAGLEDRVRLHGPSHDMLPWYRQTDVTLLTSRFEGLPFVIFESMGMARPVVVPDLGGSHEVVDASVGYVVRRRDLVDEYVAALLELERDPELREAKGAAGRRRIIDRFTVDQMAGAHARLYRRLAAEYAVAGLFA